jgi:hypothetical protein
MDVAQPKRLIWIKIMNWIKNNKPQVFPHNPELNLILNPIADKP